jgi:hypothetical protein
MRSLILIGMIILMAGCATLPDWAVDHAVRIGRAIASEYTQEKDEVADAILETLDRIAAHIESFREMGMHYEPEPMDYRLELNAALEELEVDQDTIQAVLDKLFPPPGEVQAMALRDHKRFDLFLKRVAKEIK